MSPKELAVWLIGAFAVIVILTVSRPLLQLVVWILSLNIPSQIQLLFMNVIFDFILGLFVVATLVITKIKRWW